MATEIIGSVKLPSEYFFKMAKADYSSWRNALPREFYQNSIDAAASIIKVDFNDDNKTVTIIDDGIGMDIDTLTNKLLVLGGSKKADGSVGAFGKAKELLFFSWIEYSIHTNDLLVTGVGADYIITDADSSFNGTRCEIRMPEDEYSAVKYGFKQVAQLMQTNCKIIVDDELVECKMFRGSLVRDMDWCKIYFKDDPDHTDCYMHFRINGIWMFDAFVGDLPGTAVIEMLPNSIEYLTSNRDSINYKYKNQVDKYLQELAIQRHTALRPEKAIIKDVIAGSGFLYTKEPKVINAKFIKNEDSPSPKNGSETNGESRNEAIDENEYDNATKQVDVEELTRRLSEMEFDKFSASYRNHFIVKYEAGKKNEVKKFMKTKKASKLANLLSDITRQIFEDNNINKIFVTGFVFEDDIEGQMEEINNIPCIYINPTKIKPMKDFNEEISHFNYWKKYIVNWIKMIAAHEITHTFYTYENQDFVLKLQDILLNTWKTDYSKFIA